MTTRTAIPRLGEAPTFVDGACRAALAARQCRVELRSAAAVPTVAQRIRARRLELGLSLRAAACEGVSAAYISRLESGERRASGKALRALAAKLGVSVHWLETGKEDPAEELARLVLEAPARVLPARARVLAKAVLKNGRGR